MTMTALLCAASVWTAALQRALDASADWTMERRIAESTRTLVSSGTVDCVAQSGIVWRVLAPFASSVAMTREAMVFTDEDGERTKKLDELPHYADIRNQTDAFVAGDEKAFDGLFSLEEHEDGRGGWRIALTPESSDLRRLFTRIELSGDRMPTNAVLRLPKGGTSVLRFRERPRGK